MSQLVAGRYPGIGSFSGECGEVGGAGDTAAKLPGRLLT